MNLPIPQIPPHLRDKDIHLLLPPPQPPRQQRQTKPLQPIKNIDLIPPSNLLHVRVFRPAARRPHEHFLLDINEASVVHPLHVVFAGVGAEGSAEFRGGFAEQLAPTEEVGVQVCAVGGFDGEAVVLDFEPAAGLEVSGER